MNLNKNEKAFLWLSALPFMYYNRITKLLEIFGSADEIYCNFEKQHDIVCEIVGGEENFNKMLFSRSDEYVYSIINNLEKSDVKFICQASTDYPNRLLEVDMPPYTLFCKGDISLLKNQNCIGIVGTRTPTFYGRDITEKFTKSICKNGMLVVSGMATGVDSIAHKTALDNGQKTIAVLGGGFNHIAPASNLQLSKNIEQNGLLICEYLPSHQAQSYDFVSRNRIIAGLSKCVLIPEAGKTSGALHTKNYAIDSGRDVFAIPGPITNPMSEGTNGMIKRSHAICVTEPEDVLSYYDITPNQIKQEKMPQLSLDQSLIRSILIDGETDFETLQEKTKLDTKTLNSCLTSMQISGLIKKLPGNIFSL